MTILTAKRAVIFDLDGTLVDTREAHLRAWQQVLSRAGVHSPRAALEALFGKHSDEWVRALLPPQRQHEGPRIVERKNQVFRSHLGRLRPFPRAREMLRCAKAAGKLVAFATGATRVELAHHLRLLGARRLADATVYDREVERGKPAPDIFLLAAQRLGVEPGAAAAVGDSVFDVEAARGAGMDCVALLTGGFSAQRLREAGAAEVYRDIAAVHDAFRAASARGRR